jgi:hypothetical protein
MSCTAITEVDKEKWLHEVFETWNAVACNTDYCIRERASLQTKLQLMKYVIHAFDLLSSKHQPRGEYLIPSSKHLVSEMSSSYRHDVSSHKMCKVTFSFSFLHFVARTCSKFTSNCFDTQNELMRSPHDGSSWFKLKATANRYYFASRWRREAENIWFDIESKIWIHDCRRT